MTSLRKLTIALAAGALVGLAAAPAAQASYHETTVNEVLTSNGGATAQQFVELLDPAEPFPSENGPYRLDVFDSYGTSLGSETLPSATLATVAAVRPILISTAAFDGATGAHGDIPLSVALPSAGQACFTAERGGGRVHCMSWGSIATPLTGSGGRIGGAAPGDGQSLQTQCNNTAAVAAPTPGAANRQVVTCPVSGSGGGGTGGGGTSGGDGTTPPAAHEVLSNLRIGARWRLGRLLPAFAARRAPVGTTIRFTLSEAGRVRLELLRCRATCKRLVLRATLSHSARAGLNRVRFQGRVSAHRTLAPGRYVLRATAVDAAGDRSAPAKASFTILR